MKKLIIALTLIFLSVGAFAGDGADGGGAKHSLWDQLFKGEQSMHNPKYSNDNNEQNTVVIYADEEQLQETSGLEVMRFFFDNGQEVEIGEVKMFLVQENAVNENLEEIKLKDIIGIVVGDEIILLEHLQWIEVQAER